MSGNARQRRKARRKRLMVSSTARTNPNIFREMFLDAVKNGPPPNKELYKWDSELFRSMRRPPIDHDIRTGSIMRCVTASITQDEESK